MRRSIATVSLSGTLLEKFEAIAAARFDGYELFEPDLITFNGTAADVRAMGEDLGLACELYQPFRDFEGAPDALFKRNLDRAERKFDVMQALGVSTMLCCSSTSPNVIADESRAVAQLHELAERAARRNLRVGFEALAWGRVTNRWAQAWSIVDKANHPHLGLIVDSFHTLSLRDDPSGIAKLPGERIFFMQLADAPLLSMDVLQWARHFRTFPGQGQFDVENFLEQVLLSGYSGPISLEVFNDLFRETPSRLTAVDAMRSLLYIEGQVRHRLEEPRAEDAETKARSRVVDRIELADPPSEPVLSGISFIEFAVDDESELSLGARLVKQGFRRAGKHRSKEVTLYRQNDINIVLNAEPNSYARAHFNERGPSLCTIGLLSDDPVRAVNRASALDVARFDSPIGRGETRIPGIVAPNGMVIQFVPAELGDDALFAADFDLSGDTPVRSTESGLHSIDHIAFALPLDQLDTWVLFCRAVLGMHAGDRLELADPYGLIRSAAMTTADNTVRFVFNVSTSQRTQLARTVSASGGGGLHHVAFECPDLFDTIARQQHDGVEFVPISPNYHEDLVARLDLDAPLLERMRALGVLYDRAADGEYFHTYTSSYAGRFFFEMVRRTGAYAAYGAGNAPARLASQAQAQARA